MSKQLRRFGDARGGDSSRAAAAGGGGTARRGRRRRSAAPSGTELAERQVLHVGNGAEIQTLDPHRGEELPGSNVHRDLYEGLVNEAPNGDLVPGVAPNRGPSATTARRTCSICAPTRAGRTAIPSRRTTSCSRCAAASIPKTRQRLQLHPDADPERRRDHGRQAPARGARRSRDRRSHARDHAREPDAVFPRAARRTR